MAVHERKKHNIPEAEEERVIFTLEQKDSFCFVFSSR